MGAETPGLGRGDQLGGQAAQNLEGVPGFGRENGDRCLNVGPKKGERGLRRLLGCRTDAGAKECQHPKEEGIGTCSLKKRVRGPGLLGLGKVGAEGSNSAPEEGERVWVLDSWVPRKQGTGGLDSILPSEGVDYGLL